MPSDILNALFLQLQSVKLKHMNIPALDDCSFDYLSFHNLTNWSMWSEKKIEIIMDIHFAWQTSNCVSFCIIVCNNMYCFGNISGMGTSCQIQQCLGPLWCYQTKAFLVSMFIFGRISTHKYLSNITLYLECSRVQ